MGALGAAAGRLALRERGISVSGTRFDGWTAAVSRRGVVRGSAITLTSVLAGTRFGEAEALDRNCTRFILAAGDRKDDRFRHVDDDLKVQLQRKGSRRWKTIFEDDDGTANDGGDHIRPIEFRAEYGDKIRIIGTNRQAGGCGLDEVYLFCTRGQRGKRLMARYKCTAAEGDKINFVFVDEVFRLKP